MLATRLAAAGRSVVVLEEGLGELPSGTRGGHTRVRDLLFREGGLVSSRDGGLTLLQGRCLGGSATVGHGVCEPIDVDLLGRWQDDHDWTIEGDTREAGRKAMTWLGASPLPEGGHNRNNALLLQGARRLGLSTTSLALATGAGVRPEAGSLGGPLSGVLDAARRVGVDMRVRHRVARLGRDGDRVTEATGAGFGVAAERFFLCAGALHGAALLHASGITPSGLGRGVSLTHRYLVIGRFEEPVRCLQGAATSVGATDRDGGFTIEAAAVEPEVIAAHSRLPLADLRRLLLDHDHLAAVWCAVPGGTGELSWARKGRRWLSRDFGARHRLRAREAMVAGARLLLSAGATEVALPVEGLAPIRRQGDLAALEERELVPGDAPALCRGPQGGCCAGAHGPVRPDLALRGVDNVYVCDASLFPGSAGLRPMVAIMTMAELLAARLT